MGKTNKNKQPMQQLGRERKETRQERRERMEKDRQARQQCLKYLPVGLLAVLLFGSVFVLYVKSVPPRQPSNTAGGLNIPNQQTINLANSMNGQPMSQTILSGGSTITFKNVSFSNTNPVEEMEKKRALQAAASESSHQGQQYTVPAISPGNNPDENTNEDIKIEL